MACPYFLPVGPMLNCSTDRAIVPLGDIQSGECGARQEPFTPDPRFQHEYCNFGYARTVCGRLSSPEAADAIRFTVAGDEGSLVRIRFARERDHLPHSHGAVEFRQDGNDWKGDTPDLLLFAQAKSYLKSYLRRRPRIEQVHD